MIVKIIMSSLIIALNTITISITITIRSFQPGDPVKRHLTPSPSQSYTAANDSYQYGEVVDARMEVDIMFLDNNNDNNNNNGNNSSTRADYVYTCDSKDLQMARTIPDHSYISFRYLYYMNTLLLLLLLLLLSI